LLLELLILPLRQAHKKQILRFAQDDNSKIKANIRRAEARRYPSFFWVESLVGGLLRQS
jgi:hypothetical protein